MAPQTAERQKPRSAKNEAFEVVGKVGESNPVGRHTTVYAGVVQHCFLSLFDLARYGSPTVALNVENQNPVSPIDPLSRMEHVQVSASLVSVLTCMWRIGEAMPEI